MKPSPWLKTLQARPSKDASFVEYLRWMRSPSNENTVDSGTILELFQEFESNNWAKTLTRLSDRTKKLAHISFLVKCPWRIRVGGCKGPESMLLPAFDSLGMPYIPSSTLRGIARATAKQDSETTEESIKTIFGDVELESCMGQVTFLDAYPLPGNNNRGGLAGDMANAIWKWDGNDLPKYEPNPNIFLSLEQPTFVIGLRPTQGCSDEVLEQVRNWLIQGLIEGIGARVNSGYGELRPTGRIVAEIKRSKVVSRTRPYLKMKFELEGQLIRGRQEFKGWKKSGKEWKLQEEKVVEARPIAFRSMLRYWFRALASGVLPINRVKLLEMEVFGGIEVDPSTNNPYTGLFRIEVTGQAEEPERGAADLLVGELILRHNSQSSHLAEEKRQALRSLLRTLTWLMFHLGGVGQGARRPCYRRNSKPFWRGASLIPDPEGTDKFWNLPNTVLKFKSLFYKQIKSFYQNLDIFAQLNFNDNQLQMVGAQRSWAEAVDINCQIYACQGRARGNKCFALSVLHREPFYKNSEVCGRVNPSIPSPVWIRELNYVEGIAYQVVTVFGATTGKRQEFIQELIRQADECLQIFPFQSDLQQ